MIAPFFSERARRRRRALRAAKAARPGAFVGFALRHPLDDVADGEYRDPLLLSADRTGIRITTLDGLTGLVEASWADVTPIEVQFAPDDRLFPVMVFDVRGETHRYLGAHSSGTFGLSYQQLQRMARAIERHRA